MPTCSLGLYMSRPVHVMRDLPAVFRTFLEPAKQLQDSHSVGIFETKTRQQTHLASCSKAY